MATSAAFRSVFRENLFLGKCAVVTGGGTGIGRAITQELLSLGCKVLIASRKEDRLKIAVEQLRSELADDRKENIQYLQTNIRDEQQVEKLMKIAVERFGSLDLLVNNGGGQFLSSAENISLKGWNAVVETNLTGTFLCCKHAFHQWMEKNQGSIVNIIANIYKGIPMMSHTAAARAGVEVLTRTLAVEWAQYGIRINSVAPGIVFSETANQNYIHMGTDFMSSLAQDMPAKRLARPDEISSAVCYLLSPGASYVTGATYYVDGASSLYNPLYQIPEHSKL